MTYADQLLIRDYVALQLRIARDKAGPQAASVDMTLVAREQHRVLGRHFRRLSPRKREAERKRLQSELEAVRKLDAAAGAPVNLADLAIETKEAT